MPALGNVANTRCRPVAFRLDSNTTERQVVKAVTAFAPLWDEFFPAEQARIVRLLVERVDISPQRMQVRLRAEGLQTLVEGLRAPLTEKPRGYRRSRLP
jgi:hypothetical protein